MSEEKHGLYIFGIPTYLARGRRKKKQMTHACLVLIKKKKKRERERREMTSPLSPPRVHLIFSRL